MDCCLHPASPHPRVLVERLQNPTHPYSVQLAAEAGEEEEDQLAAEAVQLLNHLQEVHDVLVRLTPRQQLAC